MSPKELMNQKPYKVGSSISSSGYVNIYFEDEGLITVPKNSAVTIVDLLNDAYRKGVAKGVSAQTGIKTTEETVVFKVNPMPEENSKPINDYKKK